MKRGFTLVELLAVIVVLGLIAAIVGISVTGTLDISKNKTREQQIKTIERAAEMWGVEHTESLPNTGTCTVSIDKLYKSGNLPEIPQDPKTGKNMNGVVEIAMNLSNNQYTYTYKQSSSYSSCN